MKKVLLTGASGFIGTHLLKQLLQDGYDVICVSNQQIREGFVNCDLQDADQTSALFRDTNPDIIIHAAALSSVTKGSTIDYYNLNVVASENVFNSIEKLKLRKRIILLSTAGVYGNQDTACLTEDLQPKPVSHYGLSKFVCERLLFNIAHSHDVTILRPFNIIGTGQADSFIVPKLVKHFAFKSKNISLGNIQPQRDYISVDLCSKLISLIVSQPKSFGEVVNICSGNATSVKDLIDTLKRLTGHNISIETSSEFIRKNEILTLIGSVKKLNSMIPFDVTTESLEASLRSMLHAEIEMLAKSNQG